MQIPCHFLGEPHSSFYCVTNMCLYVSVCACVCVCVRVCACMHSCVLCVSRLGSASVTDTRHCTTMPCCNDGSSGSLFRPWGFQTCRSGLSGRIWVSFHCEPRNLSRKLRPAASEGQGRCTPQAFWQLQRIKTIFN